VLKTQFFSILLVHSKLWKHYLLDLIISIFIIHFGPKKISMFPDLSKTELVIFGHSNSTSTSQPWRTRRKPCSSPHPFFNSINWTLSFVTVTERSKAPDWEFRSKVVGSILNHTCQQFFNPGLQKKLNKALSVRVIIICSDHRLLWQDSYKDVDPALTLEESILHKMIIMIYRDVTFAREISVIN